MTILGFVTAQTFQRWQDPPHWLPDFSFYEQHNSQPLQADSVAILQAIQQLDMTDDPIINALMTLRKIPGQLRQRLSAAKPRNTVDVNKFGFNSFTLLHQDSQELTFGLAGHFWRPTMGVQVLADADAFCQFNDLSAAKLILRFRSSPSRWCKFSSGYPVR